MSKFCVKILLIAHISRKFFSHLVRDIPIALPLMSAI